MVAEGVDGIPDPAVDPVPEADPVQDHGVPQLIPLLEGTPPGAAVIGIKAIRQIDHGLDQNLNQNPDQNPDLGQDLELKRSKIQIKIRILELLKKIKKRSSNNKKDYEIDIMRPLLMWHPNHNIAGIFDYYMNCVTLKFFVI